MNIVFLGKPGAGKGTITKELEKQGYEILPTGNILRQEIKSKTKLGEKLQELFKQGKFAPDNLINEIVNNFLEKNKEKNILMDGYPRNISQWNFIKEKIDAVVCLDCSDNIIRDRILYRQIHEPSGRVYNTKYSPPINEGLDDITNEPLITRDDDTAEILEKRLNTYYEVTQPIVDIVKNQIIDIPFLIIDAGSVDIKTQHKIILNFTNDLKNELENSNLKNKKNKL